jgi:DNA repair exonuclease SbcCD ATPase subunit
MHLKHPSFTTLILLGLLLSGPVRADDQASNTESRLREALRNSMLQLRDAQTQVATLQAAQAESDKAVADLKANIDTLNTQIATLTKQSADDKAAADKTIADLNAQVTALTAQLGKFTDAIAAWKTAYNQVTQVASAKETERAKLAVQVIMLQRVVDDREAKNFELYMLGTDLLKHYQSVSLGETIEAREPFVGISRVKLESLVQDYKDKLLDQRISAGDTPAPRLASSTPSTPAASTVAASGNEPPLPDKAPETASQDDDKP